SEKQGQSTESRQKSKDHSRKTGQGTGKKTIARIGASSGSRADQTDFGTDQNHKGQDLFGARTRSLLHLQGQGTQEVRVWQQSLVCKNRQRRYHRGNGL